ncbi:hypothetical protein B0J11DRAFT_433481 [Dendryphion nanum]|uniref:Uncharacterized protein n=1 Tax=Dendryphion nanum TaxID=256645 RepID=A0A9P9IQ38_9PLEO|nr:hypothetical protein B0J11DRAFT_433481 [Dendryphion nanum]
MSGPYRFTQDSTRSPLDRQAQNLFPPGQAPSFKTNVNRSKTKKWVEAKKNAYDGDDWGDYDEYDEYGVDETPPQEPIPPLGGRRIGEPPSRSFTDPQQQGPVHPARRNSFEADEEHRSFSAAVPPAHPEATRQGQTQGYGAIPRETGLRQSSVAESDQSDTIEHRRDFSPSAMVPPLQTRISQVPVGAATSPLANFPPRKSSIGQTDAPYATSPTATSPINTGKALPFIRPSDIYKRVEEERQRERASLDSSRPSLDSLSTRPKEEQPLASVVEGKNEQLPGVGTFGGDFWSTGSPTQTSERAPVVSSRDDRGLQSVVDQAFTRSDDQRSVPPTPQQSGVSRSNTDSTSGISPIMSRIPSSATSALKTRNQAGGDGSTPVIAEETIDTTTPIAPPTSTPLLGNPRPIARKPSPTHSRNVSSSSLPHTGLATPTRGESPARSPAIEPQKALPVPESAQLSTLDTSSSGNMKGGLGGPSAAYANREADIASAIRLSPVEAVPELSFAERQSQYAFLESHQNAQSPIQDSTPRSRSQSPSKGRVQELAGKFGDASQARRGSTQSNSSKHSVQSWERSPDGSRPSSPTKAGPSSERPAAAREVSFRPKLPGQWDSYATSVPTPSERSEKESEFGSGADRGLENNAITSPLGDVDLTPTTSKHLATSAAPADSSDPLSGLKAAGAAIGEALQSSLGTFSSQPAEARDGPVQDHSYGDIYVPRPVQFDRTVSSVSSSIPPTPPAKDTPVFEQPSPFEHLDSNQEHTPTRPTLLPQLSTLPSDQDEESDKLRKEIVASLSPVQSHDSSANDIRRSSLQPTAPPLVNRDSSILPSEYDSYWAGENLPTQPSQDAGRQITEDTSRNAKNGASQAADVPHSSILTRFSWEEKQVGSPHGQAQADAAFASPQESHHSSAGERGLPGATPTIHTEEADVTPPATDPVSVHSPASGGLHVVNSAVNPEAVDMPPRLSAEASEPKEKIAAEVPSTQETSNLTAINIPQESDLHKEGPHGHPALKSPTDKPLSSREISNIKSSPERIVTYNVTREYWANTDHGLNDWISSALAASPELASQQQHQQQPTPQYRPQVAPSSSTRHKPAGSLSLFGKHPVASPNSSNTTSQAPGTPTPALGAAEARPHGSMSGPAGGKMTGQQMQAKGKDLLHTAGVLGGKGMTGAKGLFAKGKSRFRASGSEKVDK